MALKSSREGLRKELVDYLGNLIIDDNLKNEIIKVVGNNFVTSENLNEAVNNLTMQITTESGERIDADDTLQNNITSEATAREKAIASLQELIANGTLKIDLLWNNAIPTSVFEPQTINLDITEYKMIVIVASGSISSNHEITLNIVNTPSVNVITFSNYNSGTIVTRAVDIVDNGIMFGIGFEISTYHTFQENNNCAIPTRIYGVK